MAPTKKIIGITAASLVALAVVGGGVSALIGGGSDIELAATDVTVVAKQDVTSTVPATGSIAPAREVSLATSLTGPIATLDAEVGQRVAARQLLGTIDASDTQRELDSQRASQAAEQEAALDQVEAAQLELGHLQESLGAGPNQEVTSAEAALRGARTEYDNAQAEADRAAGAGQGGAAENPEVAAAQAGIADARAALRDANSASVQAALNSFATANSGEAEGTAQAGAFINWADADAAVADAKRHVRDAEEAYARTLDATHRDAAAKQRAAADAYAAVNDAELSLAATRAAAELSARHQIETQSQAVDHALQAAARNSVAAEKSNEKLILDLGRTELRAPLAGIVTAVNGKPGQAAEGPVFTVADDSTLKLTVNVKEADVSKITVGDKATFTSQSAPGKEFTGKVTAVSPVAAAAGTTDAEAATESRPKAEFPVTIEVTGARDGLRLGSTAKVKIITDEQRDVISVPLSALLDGREVLVINDGIIERRTVQVGDNNGFSATITSGLKEGDQVINQADLHAGDAGRSASVSGEDGEA